MSHFTISEIVALVQIGIGSIIAVAGLGIAVFGMDNKSRPIPRWGVIGLVCWGAWLAVVPLTGRSHDSLPAIAMSALVAYVLVRHGRHVIAILDGAMWWPPNAKLIRRVCWTVHLPPKRQQVQGLHRLASFRRLWRQAESVGLGPNQGVTMDALLSDVTRSAIDPALALLPSAMDTPQARLLMLAIGLQESGLCARCQIVDGGGRGPARGLWQFERAGGVLGVLQHPKTKFHAQAVCKARGVQPDSRSVWEALEFDDVLAAAFARLLICSDPLVLPDQKNADAGWRLYALRTWRPGKPHPERWDGNHKRARLFVFGVKP